MQLALALSVCQTFLNLLSRCYWECNYSLSYKQNKDVGMRL